MTLTTKAVNDVIFAADHNEIYNLLKGVAASGENITLIYNGEALIFQPDSDPAAGTRVWTVKNNAGTVLASMRYDGLIKLLAASAEPASPVTGSVFFDTDDGALKVYDGASWDIVGGTVAAHGASSHTDRTRSIWIPPQNFLLRSGTPALGLQGANTLYQAWAFDAAGVEDIISEFLLPEDWTTSDLVFKLFWTNLGAGSGDVNWTVAADVESDGTNLNTGEVTAELDITAPAQNILKVSTLSPTITETSAALIRFRIVRNGAAGTDTLANDAGLIGVKVEYTADM